MRRCAIHSLVEKWLSVERSRNRRPQRGVALERPRNVVNFVPVVASAQRSFR